MMITRVRIQNFRGIKKLDLELGLVTVLIGENNSGKTSILDALKLCLRDSGSRRRTMIGALDFHLSDRRAEPTTSDPIRIELTFSERHEGEWDTRLVGRLSRAGILQVDDDRNHVYLLFTGQHDERTKDFQPNWSFLDLKGQELSRAGRRALTILREEVRFYYLAALRDAAHHFDARGPFWRPFLKDSQLSSDMKDDIEEKLQELNDLVVASHASFEQVRSELSQVQKVVSLASDEAVTIESVPGRIFELLARAQVQLGTTTGAQIPLRRHGEGTQSLAVLMLFSAFLGARPEGFTVLGLEEPEAHLHPSAIRALWDLVKDFTGQKLISTHSGELLAETDTHDIRRLARTSDGIKVFCIPPSLLKKDEKRKFNYHVRRARGELLFARCWLLVEGESETWVYPAAARALGLNLHRDGVRLVEFSQSDVGMLTKAANAFGIVWYCVGDDDTNREKTEKKVKPNLDSAEESGRLGFPYPNIEVNLLRNGHHGVYAQYMPDQNLRKITKVPGSIGYWQEYAKVFPPRWKTKAAADVAIEIERRGAEGVTPEIRIVLERTMALAKR